MTYLRFALSFALVGALGSFGCDTGNVSLAGDESDGTGDDTTDDVGPDAAPVDETSDRVTEGQVLLYTFAEGSGTVVRDRSGLVPELDLQIGDPAAVTWLPEGGLQIDSPTILTALESPGRIGATCRDAGELTVEGWVQTAAVNQDGPARILTLSLDNQERNFTLGQDNADAVMRVRTTQTDLNGTPATRGTEAIAGALEHLVYTRDPISDEGRLYVDGELVATETVAGTFENWDLTHQLAVANELTEERPWRGTLHLLAVYCRALSVEEIARNHEAGY